MATNHEIQIEAPSTNSLNGMPDPGVSTSTEYKQLQEKAKQTAKKKSTKITKETTPTPTTGTAAPRVYDTTPIASTATPSNDLAARSPNEKFNPVMDFWVPFTIVLVLFVAVFRFMYKLAIKYPSKGGYVHVPKHPHPGKPSPHIFNHKK